MPEPVLPVLPVDLGCPEVLQLHCRAPALPVRLVHPVLPVGPEFPQLHCPEPEHPERLVLQGPARRLVRWRYCPYPAQGCSDYNPPKQPTPRKR